MEKKITYIEEQKGEGTLSLKNGKKIKVPVKTIYTYYNNGTNDCKVEITKPLDLFGKQEEI